MRVEGASSFGGTGRKVRGQRHHFYVRWYDQAGWSRKGMHSTCYERQPASELILTDISEADSSEQGGVAHWGQLLGIKHWRSEMPRFDKGLLLVAMSYWLEVATADACLMKSRH